MIRLFQIEWIKLRSYRAFKILVLLYVLAVALVCSSGAIVLKIMEDDLLKQNGIDSSILPIYSFSDIWHNLAEAASWMKIILAFIVLISVTNEITFKTFRQNIIDGLNRKEYIISKTSMIIGFSIINTLLVFALGMILGIIHNKTFDIAVILSNLHFLGGFFLTTMAYLLFAFLIGTIITRTGIAIVFVMIYATFIEPIITSIFTHAPLPSFFKTIVPYFPIEAINNIVRNPFPRYILREIPDYIAFNDILIVFAHIIIYFSIITLLLKRKNL